MFVTTRDLASGGVGSVEEIWLPSGITKSGQ